MSSETRFLQSAMYPAFALCLVLQAVVHPAGLVLLTLGCASYSQQTPMQTFLSWNIHTWSCSAMSP